MEQATLIPLSTDLLKQREWVQQSIRAGKLPAILNPLLRWSRNRILRDTPVQRRGQVCGTSLPRSFVTLSVITLQVVI